VLENGWVKHNYHLALIFLDSGKKNIIFIFKNCFLEKAKHRKEKIHKNKNKRGKTKELL
jgi:hypothetical protein